MAFRFPQHDEPTRIGVLLLIAAGYFAAGQLGLLFAIPPGYATAIWPPSGIALGCLLLWGSRYWPGVFVGSLLTNLAMSYDGANYESILRSLMLATSIGGGAALQAALGAKLLRRFMTFPLTLTRERDVLGFFAIGGPLSHLVNATWGTATLIIAGAIPAAAFAQNWWTWWIGDTIGALIFAPLMVMWLTNDPAWTSRRTVVTVPLLATFAAAITLFMYTGHFDWQYLKQRFAEDSGDLSNAIAKRIDLDIETVHSLGALFAANQTMTREIDRETFERFAEPILARRAELQAVAWAPRISDAQRSQFEQTESPASLEIHELSGGQRVYAANRDEYFPNRFVAPISGNIAAFGFDIASESRRRDALSFAFDNNEVAATAPIELVQAAGRGDGLLLVLPVFAASHAESLSPAARRESLRGYVLAAIRIPQLMSVSLRNQSHASLVRLSMDDVTNASAPVIAYRTSVTETEQNNRPTGAMRFEHEELLNVANRKWRLSFEPTLDYLVVHQSPGAWLVLAGGLLFTALIGAGALLITGRAQSIEILVSHRTTELAQINEKLADEICDHLSTEHTLEKERELLRTVVNNLYEGILVLGADGELRMANGVAYGMLRDITGEESTELPKPRTFRMYAPDGITELLPEQTPHYCALRGQTVSDFEVVVQTPGRAAMTLIVNAQPLLTGDQQRHGAILVLRDITGSKAVDRMKAEFVATVSHELRTPITSIRGSLGLIAGGVAGPVPDKARKLVEIALRNSDRLAHLINDLLDMEKMESGKMHFELQRQPLGTLIEQALEANSGYAQSHNVRFALQTPLPELTVTVDSFRLLQVMSNLLSNAAKFSPAKSTVTIAVVDRVAANGANGARIARVQVTDRGPGISDEFRSRIFQKFSQADSSDTRAKSGTGLGLVICKSIIEQMGGTIGYETKVGSGSTFYFELPQTTGAARLEATG